MKTKIVLLAFLVPVLTVAGTQAAQAGQRYCREYTKSVRVGGDLQSAYGTACMQPDGSWEIVSFGGDHQLYDDIAHNAWRNGRVTRVEYRPVNYWYPAYRPVRPHYYGHRYPHRPQTVFSFRFGDNDRHRDYRRYDHRGHGKGHSKGHGKGHGKHHH